MDNQSAAFWDNPMQFYREERTRKLKQIEYLTSEGGGFTDQAGKFTGTPPAIIEELRVEIADLERMLSEAGEPFDAERAARPEAPN